MKDEIRVEVRIKNNLLWDAIVPVFGSISEFCRRSGFHASQVCSLINFRESPFSAPTENDLTPEYKPIARRLAEFAGYSCHELFPVELYAKVTQPKWVRTLSKNRLLELAERGDRAILANNAQMEMRDAVGKALLYLTLREAKIIRHRFGIGRPDGIPQTLEEVGRECGATRERIRQIESKAIRKLRHPSRGRILLGDEVPCPKEHQADIRFAPESVRRQFVKRYRHLLRTGLAPKQAAPIIAEDANVSPGTIQAWERKLYPRAVLGRA